MTRKNVKQWRIQASLAEALGCQPQGLMQAIDLLGFAGRYDFCFVPIDTDSNNCKGSTLPSPKQLTLSQA